MKLAVIGTGYVGLVVGAGFADFGNEVTCVDVDELKIARLQRGELPIYEPGLELLVQKNGARGNLRFSTELASAVAGADAIFVAVGTPPGEAGAADLSAVWAAGEQIGAALTGYAVVVVKSTVPVGTSVELTARIAARAAHPFSVVSNPEFLKEGDAVADFMKPARVIVGLEAGDERAQAVMRALYAPLTRTSDRLSFMDRPSAELTKDAANALLAVRISFMNEMALLAERLGADIESVRRGLGSDPRIGPKFLFAGAGFGGSCFPKDLRALLHTARGQEAALEVVAAAERANARQKEVLAEKVTRHFARESGDARPLDGKRVAVWGLSFKPGTDDLREAPSLILIERLLDAGARVTAYDPVAMKAARAQLGERVLLAPGMYQCVEGADALVLVTEWHEFRRPDFARIHELMREPILFDGRNVWDPAELAPLGFRYHGIGRRPHRGS